MAPIVRSKCETAKLGVGTVLESQALVSQTGPCLLVLAKVLVLKGASHGVLERSIDVPFALQSATSDA